MRRVPPTVAPGNFGSSTHPQQRRTRQPHASAAVAPALPPPTTATAAASMSGSAEKKHATSSSSTAFSSTRLARNSRLSTTAATSRRPVRAAAAAAGSAPNGARASLLGVDEDVCLMILSFCSAAEVARVAGTCKALEATTSIDSLWFELWCDAIAKLQPVSLTTSSSHQPIYVPSVAGGISWKQRMVGRSKMETASWRLTSVRAHPSGPVWGLACQGDLLVSASDNGSVTISSAIPSAPTTSSSRSQSSSIHSSFTSTISSSSKAASAARRLTSPGRVSRHYIKHQLKSPMSGEFVTHLTGCRHVCFGGGPHNKTVVSAGHDSNINVWDINSGTLVRKLKGHSRGITALTTIPFLLSLQSTIAPTPPSSLPSSPVVPPAPALPPIHTFATPSVSAASSAASSASVAAESKLEAATSRNEEDASINNNSSESDDQNEQNNQHVPPVTPFYSTHFLTGSFDKTIRLWSSTSSTCQMEYRGSPNAIHCIASVQNADLLPIDNSIVAAAHFHYFASSPVSPGFNNASTVNVWDMERDTPVSELWGYPRQVHCINVDHAFTANMILAGTDCQVMCHDPRIGIRQWSLEGGHSMPITAIHIMADGHTVISSSRDGSIRLWDIRGRRRNLAAMCEHTLGVTSMVVDEETYTILSSSFDGSIKQWCISPRVLQSVADAPPAAAMDTTLWIASQRTLQNAGRTGITRMVMSGAPDGISSIAGMRGSRIRGIIPSYLFTTHADGSIGIWS